MLSLFGLPTLLLVRTSFIARSLLLCLELEFDLNGLLHQLRHALQHLLQCLAGLMLRLASRLALRIEVRSNAHLQLLDQGARVYALRQSSWLRTPWLLRHVRGHHLAQIPRPHFERRLELLRLPVKLLRLLFRLSACHVMDTIRCRFLGLPQRLHFMSQ